MKKLLIIISFFALIANINAQPFLVNPFTGSFDFNGNVDNAYVSGGVAYFVVDGDTIASDTLIGTTAMFSQISKLEDSTDVHRGLIDLNYAWIYDILNDSLPDHLGWINAVEDSIPVLRALAESGGTSYSEFSGSSPGLVPTSLGGTSNYLRADGGWTVPAGGSGMVYPGAGIALSTGSAWSASIATDYYATHQDVSDSLTALSAGAEVALIASDSGVYNGGYDSPTMVDAKVTTGLATVDPSITNEIQTLSILGSDLSISSGNTVTLPDGGGSGVSYDYIYFKVETTTNAPRNNRSNLTHGGLHNKYINMYRNGSYQYSGADYTLVDSTLTVTTNYVTDDEVEIWISDSTAWTALTLRLDESLILLDSLISYYAFEETSGNLLDLQGSNDGVNVLTTQDTVGIVNRSYNYQATGSTTVADLEVSGNQMSISAWGYYELGDINQTLVSKYNSVTHTGISLIASEWEYAVTTANGTVRDTMAVSPTAGQWNHFVLTYDGSLGSANVKIYLNNVLVDSFDQTGDLADVATDWSFGNTPSQSFREWDGMVDEIGFWNRSLTSEDVGSLYNSGVGITFTDF